MLKLPVLEVVRSVAAEKSLVEKTKVWLQKEGEGRDKRIHASDLLRPRKAYWNTQSPEPMTPRMAGNFMVGKVLHAFFHTIMSNKKGDSVVETDVGGTWEPELGISYSNDFEKDGIPYEYKTSRTINEQSVKDLGSYLKQLCIYIAAKKTLKGRLVVLRLMAKDKDKGYGTYPAYRAYEISWTKKLMLEYRKQIIKVRTLLQKALKTNAKKDIAKLELCEDWMCGKANCGHYDKCKPEGRYGTARFDKG